ncbi:MAG: hypothetical protein Q4D05_05725 [Acinetobacter sp.]|nr:hypothetical protein [Acinetobacter sp.]
MSLWQKLFHKNEAVNEHKNHIACIESDCSCLNDEQLFNMLRETDDMDIQQGIKKILNARGYSKKELAQVCGLLPS